jgi:hypothetical protein
MPRSRYEGLLDDLQKVYYKYPQRLSGTLLTLAAFTVYSIYTILKIGGFMGNYSRVKYITMKHSHCKMFLEHGVEPDNDLLPPHLRLDRKSYLDLPDTEVVVPPLLDVIPDLQAYRKLANTGGLPEDVVSKTTIEIAGFKLDTTQMSSAVRSSSKRFIPIQDEVAEDLATRIRKVKAELTWW